jgi:hypothetical protein
MLRGDVAIPVPKMILFRLLVSPAFYALNLPGASLSVCCGAFCAGDMQYE